MVTTMVKTEYNVPKESNVYFVVGKGMNGARFYSQNIPWDDAIQTFKDYKILVNYFGDGGVVEIWVKTDCNASILYDEVCWGFQLT